MSRRAALEGLEQGLALAIASVKQLLSEPDPEDWMSQKDSPLGRRRHCQLARSGESPSARKVDGLWQVRRREIDEYIERHPSPSTKAAAEAKEEAEMIAEALAYRSKRRRTA